MTRSTSSLYDISKVKVDSHKALLVPSFSLHYSKQLVDTLSSYSILRSTIKEFHVKKKPIVAFGPSSINLVIKCLDLENGSIPLLPHVNQKQRFKFKHHEEYQVISLPYKTSVFDEIDSGIIGELDKEIERIVQSLKYRVINNL